jgi:hypothetical protein
MGADHERRRPGLGRLDHRLDIGDRNAIYLVDPLPPDRVAERGEARLDIGRGAAERFGMADIVGFARDRPDMGFEPPGQCGSTGTERRQRPLPGAPRHGSHPQQSGGRQAEQDEEDSGEDGETDPKRRLPVFVRHSGSPSPEMMAQ